MARFLAEYHDNGEITFKLNFMGQEFITKAHRTDGDYFDLDTPALGDQVRDAIPNIPKSMPQDINEQLSWLQPSLPYMSVLSDYECFMLGV